jgi:hypothetical protein
MSTGARPRNAVSAASTLLQGSFSLREEKAMRDQRSTPKLSFRMLGGTALLTVALGSGMNTQASSHREALAILSDPCVDNTDVYAWVTPGSHDKLYLIASINGLHEPGQGNQQTRLCDDVLYEFHITRGNGALEDAVTYQVQFSSTPPTPVDPADLSLPVGGGKELLIQISGVQQTYTVTKIERRPQPCYKHSGNSCYQKTYGNKETVIGEDIPVAPPNVGPQTDRIAYGLGSFVPYQAGGSAESREVGLYDDAFAATFIKPLGDGGSEGRAWAGTRDDAFYLDEKGIFDIINLAGLQTIGGRGTPGEDVFAGFNVNVIALEIPTEKVLGGPIPHNGTCGDDTLLGVWVSESRRQYRTLKSDDEPLQEGHWVQVGREAIPLVNAGLIGVQDQNKYLRTTPLTDVENFAAYFLNPILVRDAEFLGIYAALGVPQATVDQLKTNRVDILKAINLDDIPAPGCHHVPIEAGKTGDVLRVDVATDSQFPNGRMIPGGAKPNQEQVDVSDALLTLIVAGGALPVGDGVNSNDKDYLTEFPWLALPHQGLNEGHGAPAP